MAGTFPINNFQNADGTPVASGILRIRLSQDESFPTGSTQLGYTFYDFPLNSSGNSGAVFVPLSIGSTLLPIASYYIYEVFNSNGLKVAGPNKIQVVS